MKKRRKVSLIAYFARSFSIVIGLVLIWRGVWHLLDWVDRFYLGGDILVTSIGGIILGFLVLYLPDKDLKELEKL